MRGCRYGGCRCQETSNGKSEELFASSAFLSPHARCMEKPLLVRSIVDAMRYFYPFRQHDKPMGLRGGKVLGARSRGSSRCSFDWLVLGGETCATREESAGRLVPNTRSLTERLFRDNGHKNCESSTGNENRCCNGAQSQRDTGLRVFYNITIFAG